jgi:hypothetical protein
LKCRLDHGSKHTPKWLMGLIHIARTTGWYASSINPT